MWTQSWESAGLIELLKSLTRLSMNMCLLYAHTIHLSPSTLVYIHYSRYILGIHTVLSIDDISFNNLTVAFVRATCTHY